LDYPSTQYSGGAGRAGQFSIVRGSTNDGDIDKYVYWLDTGPRLPIVPTSADFSVSVSQTPMSYGPHDLFVQAVDKAGNRSSEVAYHFYAKAASQPDAQWKLDGAGAARTSSGEPGDPLTLQGTGSSWTTGGKIDSALHLDGTPGSYATTSGPAVVTNQSFTVSAWAFLANNARTRTVVSQWGTRNGIFYLQYANTANVPDQWQFAMIDGDSADSVFNSANSRRGVTLNKWTHLAGVYDATVGELRLYVDGVLVATKAHRSTFVATGPLRLGQLTLATGGIGNEWVGDIDEVRLYQRPLTGAEIADIDNHDNAFSTVPAGSIGDAAGMWTADESTGTVAAGAPGPQATLSGGARFAGACKVGGCLSFDGVNGQASTASPAVATNASFSAAAWVRLDAKDQAMDAVSQSGTRSSGFYLQYSQSLDRWTFAMAQSDADHSLENSVAALDAPVAGLWYHLAGVYDVSTNQMALYVNGVLQGTLTRNTAPWNATGPLRLGTVQWNGATRNFLNGDVDEVRVYRRALPAADVANIVHFDSAAVSGGSWNFNEATGATTAQDASGRNHRITLTVPAAFTTTGHAASNGLALPNPEPVGTQSPALAHANTSIPVVRTDASFTVSVWVKLADTSAEYTVVSQDGVDNSGFALRYLPDGAGGEWHFTMATNDRVGEDEVSDAHAFALAPTGWTHLAGMYDAFTRQLSIRVFDLTTTPGSIERTGVAWNAGGSLQVGRDRATAVVDPDGTSHAGYGSYLNGTVDELNIYAGTLSETELRRLAGQA
jgi:hypothetical protein